MIRPYVLILALALTTACGNSKSYQNRRSDDASDADAIVKQVEPKPKKELAALTAAPLSRADQQLASEDAQNANFLIARNAAGETLFVNELGRSEALQADGTFRRISAGVASADGVKTYDLGNGSIWTLSGEGFSLVQSHGAHGWPADPQALVTLLGELKPNQLKVIGVGPTALIVSWDDKVAIVAFVGSALKVTKVTLPKAWAATAIAAGFDVTGKSYWIWNGERIALLKRSGASLKWEHYTADFGHSDASAISSLSLVLDMQAAPAKIVGSVYAISGSEILSSTMPTLN